MGDLMPTFTATPVGQGELGTEGRSPSGAPILAPLDDASRKLPNTWRWRRTVQLECTRAPMQLLVSVVSTPPNVLFLTQPVTVFQQGSSTRIDMLMPHDQLQENVQLIITSHVASDPARSWTQRISCFPRNNYT